MPLLSFWTNARDEVLRLTIEQVVSNAGDGDLKDLTPCCEEFRQFLSKVQDLRKRVRPGKMSVREMIRAGH
jgi:hypothetical protein